MATRRVCDRCGAEIKPYNPVTYAGMRRVKNDINDNDYELCVSCAHELRKWFNMENAPVTVVSPAVHGVHGRWVTRYRSGTPVAEGYVSTCCDMWNNRKSDFCPNCGAKMDGGDNDAAD